MCEICNMNPCHYRCPNHKSKVISRCDCCGEELTEDYEMWEDNDGNVFCSKECAINFHGICETEREL